MRTKTFKIRLLSLKQRAGIFLPGLILAVGIVFNLNPLNTPKAFAQTEPENNVVAQLVSDHKTVSAGQSFYLALRLDHNKDWHTYWKNPGDSGQPVQVIWEQTGSGQVEEMQFTTPVVIPTPPLVTYGYKDEVFLPFKANVDQAAATGQTITFKGTAKWLECRDICLPASADISQSVRVSAQPVKSRWHKSIHKTIETHLPQKADDWRQQAVYGAESIQLTFQPPQGFARETFRFLPYSSGVIENSAEQKLAYDKASNTYTLSVPRNAFQQKAPTPLEGILSYKDSGENRSVIFSSAATTGSIQPITTNTPSPGFLLALALAFIGGLILNLMPCVLPILAIKVTHMVQHVQKEAPWRHGIAFAFGVVVAFWVLAGALLALQAAGHALGWGFQLQNPVFVLFISFVLLLVALDLFGVFEIGTGLTRLGGTGQHVKGKTGSFLTGVLATVVATPCTAPFMGTALAFTLGKAPLVVLAVFTALGLGLAAPYVLLTIFPWLLGFVPQPGPWMVKFKQILAFPILATIMWLLWVLGGQVGADGVFISLMALLAITFAVWLWGAFGQGLDKTRKQAWLVFALAGFLTIGALFMAASGINTLGQQKAQSTATHQNALAFEPGLAERLQQEGTGAFVVFTADWCITCKVNERLVLNTTPVQKAFAEKNIQMIIADWTRQDDDISNTLKKHGRAGVPFYLYYPPEAGAHPRPLPELLTKDIVLDIINN